MDWKFWFIKKKSRIFDFYKVKLIFSHQPWSPYLKTLCHEGTLTLTYRHEENKKKEIWKKSYIRCLIAFHASYLYLTTDQFSWRLSICSYITFFISFIFFFFFFSSFHIQLIFIFLCYTYTQNMSTLRSNKRRFVREESHFVDEKKKSWTSQERKSRQGMWNDL